MVRVLQSKPPLFIPKAVPKRTIHDSVAWQADRPESLTVLDVRRFCDSDAFKDCQLIASDGTVMKCHRVIVAGASPVLRKMITEDCQPAEIQTLQVAAENHLLHLLLRFMYGKRVEVSVADVVAVIKLAEQYDMFAAGRKLRDMVCNEIEGFDPQALCHILAPGIPIW